MFKPKATTNHIYFRPQLPDHIILCVSNGLPPPNRRSQKASFLFITHPLQRCSMKPKSDVLEVFMGLWPSSQTYDSNTETNDFSLCTYGPTCLRFHHLLSNSPQVPGRWSCTSSQVEELYMSRLNRHGGRTHQKNI